MIDDAARRRDIGEDAIVARQHRGLASRLSVPIPGGGGLTLLRLPPCDISASEIRQRIREGRSPANVLPPSVGSYIIQHGLYSEDSDRTGS